MKRLKGLLAQWVCQAIGHKFDGTGYFLEYVEPTRKLPIGYSHDLQECRRCGLVLRVISDTFTLEEYQVWVKKHL